MMSTKESKWSRDTLCISNGGSPFLDMNEWLQKRIDYWEDVVEKRQEELIDQAWSQGILQGFYEAMEYLNGQRR